MPMFLSRALHSMSLLSCFTCDLEHSKESKLAQRAHFQLSFDVRWLKI